MPPPEHSGLTNHPRILRITPGRKGFFDWLLIPTSGTIRLHYLRVDQ
jgi:hypothetical protein